MVLLIDNYDSFTYNLAQYLGELGAEVQVRRNDDLDVATIRAMNPSHIVISPGPGRPEEAGVSVAVIRELGAHVPLLGVCLGHQAIGLAFGGDVVRAPKPMHGKTSFIEHDNRGVFAGLAASFPAARYHSLVVAPCSIPPGLEIAARVAGEDIVMGLRHREWPIHGVQFHPESVMTSDGHRMLQNFLEM
jgi:anthranilate synthase/aminodeoxychorismate synthase-like glutamine amidotransferase